MCNACGFYCCASDVFEKCGCDHCPCSACWPDEDNEDDFDQIECKALTCAKEEQH